MPSAPSRKPELSTSTHENSVLISRPPGPASVSCRSMCASCSLSSYDPSFSSSSSPSVYTRNSDLEILPSPFLSAARSRSAQ